MCLNFKIIAFVQYNTVRDTGVKFRLSSSLEYATPPDYIWPFITQNGLIGLQWIYRAHTIPTLARHIVTERVTAWTSQSGPTFNRRAVGNIWKFSIGKRASLQKQFANLLHYFATAGHVGLALRGRNTARRLLFALEGTPIKSTGRGHF